MRWLYLLYQFAITSLALGAVWLVLLPDDNLWVKPANLAIWAVFVVDYGVRLVRSDQRRRFVRQNVPDLIAILPLDLLLAEADFGLTRALRLFRLLRVGALLWRATRNVSGVLRTNGLGFVLSFAAALVVAGGIAVWYVEPEIGTVADGIWWSLVTTTTVGYGDISPKTPPGRVVAAALMVTGITTFGLLTATLTTYFARRGRHADPDVEHLIGRLERWDELSPDERRRAAELLRALADDSAKRPS